MYSHILSYLVQFVHVGRVPLHRYASQLPSIIIKTKRGGRTGRTNFLLRQNVHALNPSAKIQTILPSLTSGTLEVEEDSDNNDDDYGNGGGDSHPSPYGVEATRIRRWYLT